MKNIFISFLSFFIIISNLYFVSCTNNSDDIVIAQPEKVNMDIKLLNDMDNEIKRNFPHINGILVSRNENLVFERYYDGGNKNTLYPMYSMTKSVMSMLLGKAIEEKIISGTDKNVMDYFTNNHNIIEDVNLKFIKIENLLTMTSGIDTSIIDPNEAYKNWLTTFLSSRFAAKPGEAFNYSDLDAHVLSMIFTIAAKKTASEYAKDHLFGPLNITNYRWLSDFQGNSYGSTGLELTARDMLKFGLLYLNKGNWNGKQLVSEEWVYNSTRIHLTGYFPYYTDYGYLWWIQKAGGHYAYFAGGIGGQYIAVIPDLKICVVIMSQTDIHHVENYDLIGKYIVPSVKK
jgi:CubicO group peptidase (beta-lactamase class C family)